jgi:hypothetical protein
MLQSINLSIFPNPANDRLNIRLNENLSNDMVEISIYNLNGAKLYSEKNNYHSGNISIDIQNLNQGFYLMQIKSGNSISFEKFQVVK